MPRQLKAWLSMVVHDVEAAERASRRSDCAGSSDRCEQSERLPIGSVAAS
jgi:hypothetical protein